MEIKLDQDVYTSGDLAKLLGVNIQTIRNIAKRNEIEYFLIGRHHRFTKKAVEKFIKSVYVKKPGGE